MYLCATPPVSLSATHVRYQGFQCLSVQHNPVFLSATHDRYQGFQCLSVQHNPVSLSATHGISIPFVCFGSWFLHTLGQGLMILQNSQRICLGYSGTCVLLLTDPYMDPILLLQFLVLKHIRPGTDGFTKQPAHMPRIQRYLCTAVN